MSDFVTYVKVIIIGAISELLAFFAPIEENFISLVWLFALNFLFGMLADAWRDSSWYIWECFKQGLQGGNTINNIAFSALEIDVVEKAVYRVSYGAFLNYDKSNSERTTKILYRFS